MSSGKKLKDLKSKLKEARKQSGNTFSQPSRRGRRSSAAASKVQAAGSANQHQPVRRHECALCNASYAQAASLYRHKKRAHSPQVKDESSNFKCNHCELSFATSLMLTEHINMQHPPQKKEIYSSSHSSPRSSDSDLESETATVPPPSPTSTPPPLLPGQAMLHHMMRPPSPSSVVPHSPCYSPPRAAKGHGVPRKATPYPRKQAKRLNFSLEKNVAANQGEEKAEKRVLRKVHRKPAKLQDFLTPAATNPKSRSSFKAAGSSSRKRPRAPPPPAEQQSPNVCSLCGLQYTALRSLRRHVKAKHPKHVLVEVDDSEEEEEGGVDSMVANASDDDRCGNEDEHEEAMILSPIEVAEVAVQATAKTRTTATQTNFDGAYEEEEYFADREDNVAGSDTGNTSADADADATAADEGNASPTANAAAAAAESATENHSASVAETSTMEISIDEGTAASAFSAFYAAAGEVAAGPPPTAEAEETKPPNYHQSIFPERSQYFSDPPAFFQSG